MGTTAEKTHYEIVRDYAIKCHARVNQNYGEDMPYEAHLDLVELMVDHLLAGHSDAKLKDLARKGSKVHDIMEDAQQSWNDVCAVVGEELAEIARLCTVDPRVKSRAEKHTHEYYQAIAKNHAALIVKVADRLANVVWSKHKNSRMINRYRSEHNHFCASLHPYLPERYKMLLDQEMESSEVAEPFLTMIDTIYKKYPNGTRIGRLERLVIYALRTDRSKLDPRSNRALAECLEIINEMK